MKNLYQAFFGDIKQIQWLELQKQLLYSGRKSSFYQRIFSENSIDPRGISSYVDFLKIPITTKDQLQQFNEDFRCVPPHEIIDYVTTSGTLGKPVSLGLNEEDLERLALNEMRSFEMVGITKNDIVQITTTLDRRFMAGMAYFLGLRKLGAGIVRTGSGLPQLQWDSIERFSPNYLIAVPSFLLKMTEYAQEHQIDLKNTSVKAAVCIGEPIRDFRGNLNALGKRITEMWNIELFSTYASTEMATAFTECKYHNGNHVQPELILPEILAENGEPVQSGEIGELVITTLQNTTMPLIRFATGDMLTYYEDPCPCGRNTIRLSPVIGRKNQVIKYKGTSIYPQHIIEVLNDFPGTEQFVIIVENDHLQTEIIKIKLSGNFNSERLKDLKDHFKSQLHVTPILEFVSREEVEKLSFNDSRKPKLFIDLRKSAHN